VSLVDRTNEEIPLSLMSSLNDTLYVDADFDSALNPTDWVHFSSHLEDDLYFKMTYAEAGLLHDRLGLILGRSGTEKGA